jgi:hypothetical protein
MPIDGFQIGIPVRNPVIRKEECRVFAVESGLEPPLPIIAIPRA